MANRTRWLLAALAVLIVANLAMQFSGGGPGVAALFDDGEDVGGDFPPDLRRKAAALQGAPRLSFSEGPGRVQSEAEVDRNPFLFGVDRRKEQEQQRRREEMARIRQQMEEARAATAVEAEAESAEPAPPRFEGEVIGLMRRSGGDAMISVRYENEVLVLRPGDTLDGRFKLLAIEGDVARFLALDVDREFQVNLELE